MKIGFVWVCFPCVWKGIYFHNPLLLLSLRPFRPQGNWLCFAKKPVRIGLFLPNKPKSPHLSFFCFLSSDFCPLYSVPSAGLRASFRLLSSAFCLLSSISCVLSSLHHFNSIRFSYICIIHTGKLGVKGISNKDGAVTRG